MVILARMEEIKMNPKNAIITINRSQFLGLKHQNCNYSYFFNWLLLLFNFKLLSSKINESRKLISIYSLVNFFSKQLHQTFQILIVTEDIVFSEDIHEASCRNVPLVLMINESKKREGVDSAASNLLFDMKYCWVELSSQW